jgi:hypothetical protein
MRYALLLTPLLPLALAACLTGGRLDHAATGGITLPALPMPGRDWRITEIAPDGSARSVRYATTLDVPQIHMNPDGRWSVGTLGVFTLAGPAPRSHIFSIEPVTD